MSPKRIPLSGFAKNAEPFSYLSAQINKISALALYRLQNFPLTANGITMTSLFFVGLAPMAIFFLKSKLVFILVLGISYGLDTADGIWARTKGEVSRWGGTLDQFTDYVKDYVVDVSIFFYYFLQFNLRGSPNVTYFLLFLSGYLIAKSLYYLASTGYTKEKRRRFTEKVKVIVYTPAEKYFIAWPLAILVPEFFGTFYVLALLGYVWGSLSLLLTTAKRG